MYENLYAGFHMARGSEEPACRLMNMGHDPLLPKIVDQLFQGSRAWQRDMIRVVPTSQTSPDEAAFLLMKEWLDDD